MTSVGLCIISHDRPGEVASALRSADAEPWDEVVVLDMASDPHLQAPSATRLVRQDVNAGSVVGRNLLCDMAGSDVLVFIDDDATFLSPVVNVVRSLFEQRPTVAAVAFAIRRPGGAIVSKEFPFRGRVQRPEVPRSCAYFVGAGYAVRRTAVKAVGGYDEQISGYGEELELSCSLLREGWEIWYEPDVVVEHRPSPRGREAASPVNSIRHRVLVARRYLPLPVAALHLLLWIGLTLTQSVRACAIRRWWTAMCEGFGLDARRRPFPWSRLLALHRIGGRVLW